MAKDVVKVFAPATLPNFNSGFGVLGTALEQLGDEILLRKGRRAKGLVIREITGDKGMLSHVPAENPAGIAALSLLEAVDASDYALEMIIRKRIPLDSSFGALEALACAGAFAVNELFNLKFSKHELLPFAAKSSTISNVWNNHALASCMLGGITLTRDADTFDTTKIYVPRGLCIVTIHPRLRNFEIAKTEPTIDIQQHIAHLANTTTLATALYNSDFDKIRRSLNENEPDLPHINHIPHYQAIKDIVLKENALGFSICGQGPSMFVVCHNSLVAESIMTNVAAFYKEKKINTKIVLSSISQEGVFEY